MQYKTIKPPSLLGWDGDGKKWSCESFAVGGGDGMKWSCERFEGGGVRGQEFIFLHVFQWPKKIVLLCYIPWALGKYFSEPQRGGIYNSQDLDFKWSQHSQNCLDLISTKVGHTILFQDKILGGPFGVAKRVKRGYLFLLHHQMTPPPLVWILTREHLTLRLAEANRSMKKISVLCQMLWMASDDCLRKAVASCAHSLFMIRPAACVLQDYSLTIEKSDLPPTPSTDITAVKKRSDLRQDCLPKPIFLIPCCPMVILVWNPAFVNGLNKVSCRCAVVFQVLRKQGLLSGWCKLENHQVGAMLW